jgi:Rps23 Pro-64 3,4-dihydroxylase Tpa1-like proline 4-hydroxylase
MNVAVVGYLNTQVDIEHVRASMERHGRVLVRDIFEPQVANALRDAMTGVDWSLSYRDPAGDAALSGASLRAMDAQGRAKLGDDIHTLAQQEFQFSFFSHSMVASAKRGDNDLLTRFVRWMAMEDFLSSMRAMTGIEDLRRVYAQATMYVAGSFLLTHSDEVGNENRRLAYVINLTTQWRPDWGGLLHFCDAQGNVVDTFFPHFNSMSIFKVPQDHFVSYVAPYAQGERLAVTGWLIGT